MGIANKGDRTYKTHLSTLSTAHTQMDNAAKWILKHLHVHNFMHTHTHSCQMEAPFENLVSKNSSCHVELVILYQLQNSRFLGSFTKLSRQSSIMFSGTYSLNVSAMELILDKGIINKTWWSIIDLWRFNDNSKWCSIEHRYISPSSCRFSLFMMMDSTGKQGLIFINGYM